MSAYAGKMYHPYNATAVDTYTGFNWPCLFCGVFWFMYKGLWAWAVGAFFAALLTGGLAWFAFPFFANSLHLSHLQSNGYLTTAQLQARQSESEKPSVTAPPLSVADELKKFDDLRAQGVITEEDFQKKKRELLG